MTYYHKRFTSCISGFQYNVITMTTQLSFVYVASYLTFNDNLKDVSFSAHGNRHMCICSYVDSIHNGFDSFTRCRDYTDCM